MSIRKWARVGVACAACYLVSCTVARAQSSYGVALQCDSDQWVFDGSLFAECTASSPWSFEMDDLNGGNTVEDGDVVEFIDVFGTDANAFSIHQFGGVPIDVDYEDQSNPTNEEKWVIENMDCDGCTITDGTRVSLQNVANGKFWSAASCGGGDVNANASSRGACEMFEIKIY